jgi:predicted ATPase/class 3 adenylate cyclase
VSRQVFLFTDIEGSTKKWERYPDEMSKVLSRHDAIMREVIEKHGGLIIKHTGDGVFAIFENGDPFACAIALQKKFATEDWGKIGELRVRIGLHAGTAEKRGKDYFGPVINRTARVMGAAWGGQIVLTPEVKQSAKLPEGAVLQDLGAHLLKDLYEPQQLLGLVHPDMGIREFPPLHSLSSHHHNLPVQATPFLGREEELGKITELLRSPSCRLVTLIGPGGIGKTRLAIQAAAEEIERFSHGVYFIPLDPLSSAEFLVSAIAEALKFSFYSKEDEKVQLLNYLREKELLLILDNFEHLVAGAGMISEVLNVASGVKIMVTSRELLNLRGEWIVQVGGMEVPEGERIDVEGYSAVQLFLHTAQRVRTGVEFTDEDKRFVVRICQLVGGLPLGIEIASSWLRSLSCKEIAQEIEKGLDFLETSMRDVPERHRSLRAVFDYSWDLLGEVERGALRRLSVFVGGFSREAAEEVAGARLGLLTSLVDKSLLRRHTSGRYEMLDVLRQYVREKLDEEADEKEEVLDKHCQYYANFLESTEQLLFGGKKEGTEAVRAEIENVRAAWNHAVERCDVQAIDKSLKALAEFHDTLGQYEEGRKALERAAAVVEGKPERTKEQLVYGKLIARIGNFHTRIGSYEKGSALMEQAIDILKKADAKQETVLPLTWRGRMLGLLGRYEEAKEFIEESLRISREIGYKLGIAINLNALGVMHYYVENYSEARKLFDENLKLSKTLGYQKGTTSSYTNLGLVAYQTGRLEEAQELMTQALEIDRMADDKLGIANILNNIGLTYKEMENFENARKYYADSLVIRREIGDRMGMSISLNNLGNLGGKSVDPEEALAYHRESLAIRRDIGDTMGVAQSLNNLARQLWEKKEYKEAKECYYEALMAAVDSKEMFIIHESLLAIAISLRDDGKSKESARILVFLQENAKEDEDLYLRVGIELNRIEPPISEQERTKIKEQLRARTLDDMVAEIIGTMME